MPVAVLTSSAPFAAPKAVGVTPGVVSATLMPGVVPVMLLSATAMVGTAWPARPPANVTVIVPIPAVSVPAAVVTLPVPIAGSASSAASTAAMSVALTLDQ